MRARLLFPRGILGYGQELSQRHRMRIAIFLLFLAIPCFGQDVDESDDWVAENPLRYELSEKPDILPAKKLELTPKLPVEKKLIHHNPLFRLSAFGTGMDYPNSFSSHSDTQFPKDTFGGDVSTTINLRLNGTLHMYVYLHGGTSMQNRISYGEFLMATKGTPFELFFLIGGQGHRIRMSQGEQTAGPLQIETEQNTNLILGSLGFGLGRIDRMHVRAEVITGWFERTTLSVISNPQFTGKEPLSFDALPLKGGRFGLYRIPVANRIHLDASLQYLEIMERKERINTPTPEAPFTEWRVVGKGTLLLNRHFSVFGKYENVFGEISFAPKQMFKLGFSFGT